MNAPLHRRLAGTALVALFALSACGSGSDGSADGGSSDPTSESVSTEAGADSSSGIQENRPVTVEGTPLAPYDSSLEDLTIGEPSPVVSGESFDGTPVTFGGESENPRFVVFLAHWCPHCNDEIPELLELQADGRIPDGLDVIGVSTAVRPGEENYPPSQWMVDMNWAWPVMADDEEVSAIAAAGGTSFPFALVLDTDGTVLARRAGQASADDTVEFLEQALSTAQA